MNIRKPFFSLVLATFLIVSLTVPIAAAQSISNGAQSGKHYTLNLLGKDWEHADGTILENKGHRIFVGLGRQGEMRKTRIMLLEGNDFDVIDADGTDGKATFMLPKPNTVIDDNGTPYDPSDDSVVSSAYTIYIRVLGKPSGLADMYSGFIDEYGQEWFSLETITLRQEGGKVNRNSPPKFEDVTKELTTIFVDITDDETDNPQRYGLFDNELWEYFWDYDNQGLKHVQLRFYPVA